jgi:hypothetical protein
MNNEINNMDYNPPVGAMLDPNGTYTQYGITLRDHFAGLALQGILSHYGFRESDELLAKHSYNVADAMLKARLVTEDKEVKGANN